MAELRWMIVACVGLTLAAFAPEGAQAQKGPPALPPGLHDRALPPGLPPGLHDRALPPGLHDRALPPGLHDRALPPGTPFEDGGFDPPGRTATTEGPGNGGNASAEPTEAGDPSNALNPGDPNLVSPDGAVSRWAVPGMAASTPHGYGAGFGEVWVGASYQPRARRSDGSTGAAAFGFGLGDPERYVGFHVGVNSFSTVRSGFWNRSGLDVQAHRILPGDIGLAIGWEGAVTSGRKELTRMHSGSNRYAVASRWFQLRPSDRDAFNAVMLSIGVGDGRFQSERAFMEERNGVGVFGSAAVRVAAPVSLIAEWTGQDLMFATSVTPLRDRRFAITAGMADVTGNAGDGARFAVGFSAAYDFLDR